ncbi:MAG: solute carrier family 13 (sodium-dependent dicarboxylate transporter), er 2/3/5 [Pyrinomonadaceae bacterium]|nr:solute carrier family 13 (sodium-dependent dicarboxylate transporter), er 2/3/5 [Pyrinomonadaceae bacterium]
MDRKLNVVEQITEGEARFERVRRAAGFVLAPSVFILLLLLPLPALKPEAHRLAAVMAAVVILWVTEALPLPATALAGAAACVVLRVAPARDVFAPFADPLMFLFIGSFIIARAIFLHRLDRRLAFGVLSIKWVGARPGRILVAFGAVTAFISAWISNTATTAMMFAIGMAILAFLFDNEEAGGSKINRRYATGLMLMTSFAASIGGLATPIGTPPNVIGLGFIRQLVGVEFPFFKWAMIGTPVVIILFLYLSFYLNFLCPAGVGEIEGSREMLKRERERLGAWTRGQKSTLIAFLATVVLWVVPGFIALIAGDASAVYQAVNRRVPEAVAAIAGAMLLFLLPGDRRGERAITWDEAVKIDWGVVLLYGGGFALGVLSFQTGLAEAIGYGLTKHLPISGGLSLLFASTLVATLTSEATSNTASANMVVPVVIAISRAAGADPLEPALGATMGASLGFMLPVSTPCNAIVYGSGYIPLGRMIRYGLLLDVVGVFVIVALVRLLVPYLR